ncbi:ATP-binding protein [Azospirillum sp. HJ39]|uniref:ATP-binding protein n=1 Tax=Azospirillum sp. HJ39 TaxID=3159496 RepID=UPI00355651FB
MTDGTTIPSRLPSGSRTRFAGLIGPGLSSDRLDPLAGALGLRPATVPAGSCPADGPLAAVLTGGWGTGMQGTGAEDSDPDAPALWLPPVAAWIEPAAGTGEGTAALAPQLAPLLAEASSADLYVNLTTATAHGLQLGARLLAALAARHPLAGDRRNDIELALHEAVSNALVHGNLGVAGMKELSAVELERFSRDLRDRLGDPVLAARRVVILVRIEPAENGRPLATVEIADEGAGFVPAPRGGGSGGGGASGRGLDLIGTIAERLEIVDGGRRIRLRFGL